MTEENQTPFNWAPLCVAENMIEANLIKGWLENQQIQVRLSGESLIGAIGEIPAQEASISLFVYQIKLRRAQQILLEYRQQQSLGVDWHCHHCGELNASSFEICWSCLTEKYEQT